MTIDYDNLLKELLKDYEIAPSSNPYLLCFIGGPGYGKSYLAKEISKKENIPIVSNDKIRRLLDSKGIDSKNQEIIHKLEFMQVNYLITNGSSIIMDSNAIRKYEMISKIAKDFNINCYYINLISN